MSIASENILFDWRVRQIVDHARKISSAAHLFGGLTLYDTALDKLDLRQSATALRDAAEQLDAIAARLKGPATAFPDLERMEAAQ